LPLKTKDTFACYNMHQNEKVRRKRLYIIFFALLQLVVFLSPLVIKFFHHHEIERIVFTQTTNKTIANHYEQCPICHFEFVNFISTNNEITQSFSNKFILLISSGETRHLFNSPLQFFSNRAPPPTIA
jgi:hypothetical protein